MEKGSAILKEDFDFLILPGSVCEDILLEEKVDLFINIRSFMEMPKSQIKTYFDCVHRSLRLNGIFACFNRYSKAMKVHGKIIEGKNECSARDQLLPFHYCITEQQESKAGRFQPLYFSA